MSQTHPYRPFRERLDAFARELKGVGKNNVGALHRARVASRRLRELIPLLELDRETAHGLARRLRRVTRTFGVVRELDVLMLLIEELAQNERYKPAALKPLLAAIDAERSRAREHLSAKLPTAKLKRLVRSLESVDPGAESHDTMTARPITKGRPPAWLWALEARMAQRRASLDAAIEDAGAVYVPERLHGVRIAVKRLRYAAELLAEAGRKSIAPDIAVLKATQDLLGRLHDLEVLLVRVREAQASLPDLASWRDFNALVRAVEGDCRLLHARYMRNRPDLVAIVNRMDARPQSVEQAASRPAV
jgi:CHAD domain-containing protein